MTSTGRLLALLTLPLALAATRPVSADDPPSVMDRLTRLFVPGRPIGFQVVLEQVGADQDVDVNTTVAEVKELDDPAGRQLTVFTASYEREGSSHRFVFVIRDGELTKVELQVRAGDRWERAPPEVFSFQSGEDPPPPDFLGEGDAVLILRGFVTPRRGATTRAAAVIALRSFHTAEGEPPAW